MRRCETNERTKRFLIVNRDLHLQDLLVSLLQSRRVSAVGVTTGEEASIAARLICFDAVLFDVASRDDWDSLARLRGELSREVPIVALSGCVSKVDRTETAPVRSAARHLSRSRLPWR